MIKKKVTYIDLDGKEKTEELRFHMNKLEYIKFVGGIGIELEDKVKELTDNNDVLGMTNLIENLLVVSYGKMDGKKWTKSEEDQEEFRNSEQLAELFAELITNPDEAAKFFKHVSKARCSRNSIISFFSFPSLSFTL